MAFAGAFGDPIVSDKKMATHILPTGVEANKQQTFYQAGIPAFVAPLAPSFNSGTNQPVEIDESLSLTAIQFSPPLKSFNGLLMYEFLYGIGSNTGVVGDVTVSNLLDASPYGATIFQSTTDQIDVANSVSYASLKIGIAFTYNSPDYCSTIYLNYNSITGMTPLIPYSTSIYLQTWSNATVVE